MARRYFRNGCPQTTLTAGINGAATSISVAAVTSWPSTRPYTAVIDYGQAGMEVVLVTNVVGTTLTVTRGYDGTAGVSHSSGATIQPMAVAIDLDEASAHINSSSGVHGLPGTLVDTTSTQTLSGKTLASPTLTGTTTAATVTASGPVAGSALSTSGNATVGGALGVSGTSTLGVVNEGNTSITGTLGVTGTTTAAQVNATGVAVSGNATVSGTLGVTGTATVGAVAATSGTVSSAPSSGSDIANKTFVDKFNGAQAARAYRTSAQSLSAGTEIPVQLNLESYDYGNNFNTTTNQYVVPETGLYEVKWACTATLANATEFYSSVWAGSTLSQRAVGTRLRNNAGGGAIFTSTGSDNLALTAGDGVKLYAFGSVADSLVMTASQTYLSIRRVG